MKNVLLRLATLTAALLLLSACGKKQGAATDHSDHGHEGHGHLHTAPHGGLLLELGDHQFNLELVHDPLAGKLTAFVLDAHAENFVRITQRTIELTLSAQGQTRVLALNAIANAATGETVGNTSQFEASADWLKGAQPIAGSVGRLEIRTSSFNEVKFMLKPAGGAKP